MAQTHTTFAAAKTLLAARLGHPSKTFWVDAELGFALKEAKRLWNVITLHDRDTGIFSTSSGITFYSLSSLLESSDGTLLRAMTLRDRDLMSEIQYHLMERQNLVGWSGTDQFTFNQILTAIQRRRDQFLADTACVISERTDALDAGSETFVFPETVIGVRRVVFIDGTGKYHSLRVTDERMANARGDWRTEGTPNSYSVTTTPNLTIRIIPPPATTGSIKTLIVSSGATLDTTANGNLGTLLGIPDDYAWGVKYGVLADLYSDAASVDTGMVEICEAMYALAVDLAIRMPVVLHGEINGIPTVPSSISSLDGTYGWQGMKQQVPTQLGTAGPDTVAMYKVPNGSYDVSLDVVRNAIVPADDDDYIEIGREHLDALLGMAQRICMLKVGGDEFTNTEPLANKFFSQANEYSYRRSAASTALQVLRNQSTSDTFRTPWKSIPRTVEDSNDEVKNERNARRRPFRKR